MEKCKGCKKYTENADCKECEPDYKPTNADRIRAMSDEELAEFLYNIDHYWNIGECIVKLGDEIMQDNKEDILDWLQEQIEI